MPVRVQCPNPDCQASFSVHEGDAAQFERCPKCGCKLTADGEPRPGRTGPAYSPEDADSAEAPPPSGLKIGSTFARRYLVVRQLGRGGMGVVYLARDVRLERDVALKLPYVWGDESAEYLHRFHREARAAAGLRHPSICPVYDVDEHEGQPYLVLAFVEGMSLADHLKSRSSPMEAAEAVRLVRKLAQVMAFAHERGVIHRDLKPANIMLDLKAGPIVMDFGLARREGREESVRTQSGQLLGTPAYMPLEQFQGKVGKIGPHSDVYSLGVILFELLTGRRPYEGDLHQICVQLLTSDPPAPSSLRRGVEQGLDRVCRKAMAKEIEDRYASMGEFDQALREIAEPKPPPPPPLPPPPPQRPRLKPEPPPEPIEPVDVRAPARAIVGRVPPRVRGISAACVAALLVVYLVALLVVYLVIEPMRQAARRSQCVNNLKQIGRAMDNYEVGHDTFPPAYTVDKSGKPLLSWRVLILPYLEHEALYKEFHLDEPWDSPHNRTLIDRIPPTYLCPEASFKKADRGKTTYLAPRGKSTVMPGAEGVKIFEITDGTSNTIFVADAPAAQSVVWTKPDDWEVDNADMTAIFGEHLGGTDFLFVDGSVRSIRDTVSPAVLQKLLSKNGHEVFSSEDY